MVLSTAFSSCKPGEKISDLTDEEVDKRMRGSLNISAASVKIAINRVDYSNQILTYFAANSSAASTSKSPIRQPAKVPATIYRDFENPTITDQKLKQHAGKIKGIYTSEHIFQKNKVFVDWTCRVYFTILVKLMISNLQKAKLVPAASGEAVKKTKLELSTHWVKVN